LDVLLEVAIVLVSPNVELKVWQPAVEVPKRLVGVIEIEANGAVVRIELGAVVLLRSLAQFLQEAVAWCLEDELHKRSIAFI